MTDSQSGHQTTSDGQSELTDSDDGLELKNTSGRKTTLWLSKIGDIRIRHHREILDKADIKEVTIKKETTGDWFVSFGLEADDAELPEKSDVDSLDTSNSVGIDLGILNHIHTSGGTTVDWLDFEDECDRLQREQRNLSRKQKGQTTTRSSVERLPKSSVTSSGRCWTTSTKSRLACPRVRRRIRGRLGREGDTRTVT